MFPLHVPSVQFGEFIMKIFDLCCQGLKHSKGLGKGTKKKSLVFFWGVGVSEGRQKAKPQVCNFFSSVSMQNHSRTPKTCFTLGLWGLAKDHTFSGFFQRPSLSIFMKIYEKLTCIDLSNLANR